MLRAMHHVLSRGAWSELFLLKHFKIVPSPFLSTCCTCRILVDLCSSKTQTMRSLHSTSTRSIAYLFIFQTKKLSCYGSIRATPPKKVSKKKVQRVKEAKTRPRVRRTQEIMCLWCQWIQDLAPLNVTQEYWVCWMPNVMGQSLAAPLYMVIAIKAARLLKW